jgi:hypothetical protein
MDKGQYINRIRQFFIIKKVAFTNVLLILPLLILKKMDIENLIAVFDQKLMLQRYNDGSIKNYSSSVWSFLQVAEKRFDQPDELNENEIEKYVYRKIRKDNISSSYRFANVLFCAWTVHFIVFSFSVFM